ncbi:hypothetical protein VOLCADRAFT_100782 [Volvox carteri f. nagariensis]|uniref:Phospholipid/glycerol acyltransferase domain-containing protein n=1 Tax=Volvox carteri f. nagariensis TaxID=3068 RepID=D8UL09_VOLCA|nr:uncharacterized protein VOLCADRAFT_100782 [Volvox carteri f. nagariensis]EFJ39592.1 hypothetical protein VOLCADRAFT_100782 [Volvox carteri f. nagariensis]|eukprot:XP_002959342.1 hypothetical protein VOLCADRAFT_100782 [Volvox carteri f. nagariensis]
MALLLPLLPLRIAIGGLALVAIAIINSLAAWNWPPEVPLTPWRRRIVVLSKELVVITLWCLGFRIRIRGRENIKIAERLGAVAVFNHVSWVDAFVLVWLMAPSGISKESNSRLPVLSQAVRALQTVYIPYNKLSKSAPGSESAAAPAAGSSGVAVADAVADAAKEPSEAKKARQGAPLAAAWTSGTIAACDGDGESCTRQRQVMLDHSSNPVGSNRPCCSNEDIARSNNIHNRHNQHNQKAVGSRVTEVLQRRVNHPLYCKSGGFPMLVMAPEGTTANGRCLLNFRTGAFVLRRPVLPICFRFRWRALNPAWTIHNERWHFLRLVSQFRNDLEVEILPPYKPSEDELQDPRLFASHVRRQMAAVLDVPMVNVSHDDFLALRSRGIGVSWDGRRLTFPSGARGSTAAASPGSAVSPVA